MSTYTSVRFAGSSWNPSNNERPPHAALLHVPEDIRLDYAVNPTTLLVGETHRSMDAFRKLRREDQIRVFFSGEALVPDFNLFDFAVGFDHIDFGERYFRPHPMLMFPRYAAFAETPPTGLSSISGRTEFCDFIYSNGQAHPMRAQLFRKLSEKREVCAYGRLFNNRGDEGLRVDWNSDWRERKIRIQSRHKFSIVVENSLHVGYTSEKLLTSLIAGSIPLYWGNPLVGLDFNENRFINLHNFPSMDAAIKHIMELDADEARRMQIVSEPWFTGEQEDQLVQNTYKLQEWLRTVFATRPNGRKRGHGTMQWRYEDSVFAGHGFSVHNAFIKVRRSANSLLRSHR